MEHRKAELVEAINTNREYALFHYTYRSHSVKIRPTFTKLLPIGKLLREIADKCSFEVFEEPLSVMTLEVSIDMRPRFKERTFLFDNPNGISEKAIYDALDKVIDEYEKFYLTPTKPHEFLIGSFLCGALGVVGYYLYIGALYAFETLF